jgi:hypothetical protein
MKTIFLALALTTAAVAQSPVKPVKMAAADKVLVLEVTVPASLSAVWEAFTTSAGLSTWLTPGAVVDLKEGLEWTAHFPGAVRVGHDFEFCSGEGVGRVGSGSG